MFGVPQILMSTIILLSLAISVSLHGRKRPDMDCRILLLGVLVDFLILWSANFWTLIRWPQLSLLCLYVLTVVVSVFAHGNDSGRFNVFSTFITQAGLVGLYYCGGFFG